MTYKCKYNKEMTCPILNKQLGDCEIDEDGLVVWRCPDYVKVEGELAKSREQKDE